MEDGDRLDGALCSASGLVFVCTGNMVRSAFAELYARHRGLPLPVRSVATRFRNDGLFPETAVALRARGVPEAWIGSFRPTHVDDDPQRLDGETVVFGMSRGHLDALRARGDAPPWMFLLSEVRGERRDIADPVLEGADFAATFAEIERCVDKLAERLAPAR